ncbi:unnamed protein product [Adineta steineri]|uniref:RRM domain-containing protein n=2 Tax=Adineta steineri TaxID=433720 RepID=A0A815SN06_9BILA|nr:unnamed protein product [Adineta steineri]CAF1492201.1 unnamed protein product [Adineta steineri]
MIILTTTIFYILNYKCPTSLSQSVRRDRRTIKVSNIPTNLSIDQITNLFSDGRFENIHIPVDNLDNQIGVTYITFDTIPHCQQFISNIIGTNKYWFINNDTYNGPVLVEQYDLREYIDINDRIQSRIKNMNDPDDNIATKIGQLYINMNKKMEKEINDGLDEIKQQEEQEEIQKLKELERLKNEAIDELKAIGQ